MSDGGPQALELSAGMIAIVPQGVWHRFDAPAGMTMMTVTPSRRTIRPPMSRTRGHSNYNLREPLPTNNARVRERQPRRDSGYHRSSGHRRAAMTTILDLKDRLAKMPMLQGRRPETTEAERKASGAFVTLAPFRDGNIYSAKFSGRAAWERHPNGDELVQIVAGSTSVELIVDGKVETHELSAGATVVVPLGAWHRFHAPNGVSIVTATPRPTEHLTVDVDDPRALTEDQRLANSEEKVG
jgi:quercetin dioxygenase-like cupin family protein